MFATINKDGMEINVEKKTNEDKCKELIDKGMCDK